MQCQKHLKFPLASSIYFVHKRLIQAKIRGHRFGLRLETGGWSLQSTRSELLGCWKQLGEKQQIQLKVSPLVQTQSRTASLRERRAYAAYGLAILMAFLPPDL